MVNLILASLSFLIFIVYNIVAIYYFGIPSSLSNTYYYYNEKLNHPEWKLNNIGIAFTLMMFCISFLLLPAWLNITEVISSWSKYFTVLPFLGSGAIAFVGAAPAFRSCKMEDMVHTISACAAAGISLFWVAVVCWKLIWLIPLWVLLIGAIAHLTKTAGSCKNYWLEMVAFGSTFSAIIIESILLL